MPLHRSPRWTCFASNETPSQPSEAPGSARPSATSCLVRFIWQLQAWRLLGQRHQPDDRHEYFEAMRRPPMDALSLALNSWMQTPTGVELRGGELFFTSWAEVIFNPSFTYRLAHMLPASGLTVAFLLAGLSAWQILCRRVRHCRNGKPVAVQPTRRGFHSPSSVQLGRLLS